MGGVMTFYYTNCDIEHLKTKAAAASDVRLDESGLELIRCVDGIYRTPEQKAAYEERLWKQLTLAR